ncbi:hypothetical protein I551_8453, partial [Mycobacterium ulcerans str. Harvey]
MHSVTFAIGHRIGRYNVVDVAWGRGSSPLPPFRRYWAAATRPAGATAGAGGYLGLRLSRHIHRKRVGKEKIRATRICSAAPRWARWRKVFVLQAFLTLFISFPLQLSAVTGRRRSRCWPSGAGRSGVAARRRLRG